MALGVKSWLRPVPEVLLRAIEVDGASDVPADG